MPHLLVIEGNTAPARIRHIAAGGQPAGEAYADLLTRLEPAVRCRIVYPADEIPSVALGDFSGAIITGSALNIYDGGPEIDRQIHLVQAIFAAGLPIFGSCWGLQLAVTAAGGVVRRNPRGREFGFARRLCLTDEGRTHPMYRGKPDIFEAITVHLDEIETLPSGAQLLCGNDVSDVQAACFRHDRGEFWGVQYHPEYSFAELSATTRRYGPALLDDGLFTSLEEDEIFQRDLARLEANPADRAVCWRLGLGPAIQDTALRLCEIDNWLRHKILARAG